MIKQAVKRLILLMKQEKKVPVVQAVSDSKLLDGKTALITGGSSGIGLAIAKAFIASGARVIICGTNQAKLDKAVSDIDCEAVKGMICNVRDVNALPEKVEQASKIFAEGRIDILVNSAGLTSAHNFWTTDERDYDSLMETNAKGTFFMSQAVAMHMIEKKIKGHILNISSASAMRPAWTPYQMSKWAVKGFTLGLADTLLPYGIIVNAIAPGQTATPMLNVDAHENIDNTSVPIKRYILPEEIASLAVFMVSGAGDAIVGDTFYMTGGSGIISLHS